MTTTNHCTGCGHHGPEGVSRCAKGLVEPARLCGDHTRYDHLREVFGEVTEQEAQAMLANANLRVYLKD